VINVIRYEEKFDPNHAQECICHKSPMSRGLEESLEGSYVDYEEYEKLKQRCAWLENALSTALSDKILDLVRCGIGGNYGGTCYNEAIENYHSPLVQMKEQLRKEQE
jgi:glucose-6-phosphate isomerase